MPIPDVSDHSILDLLEQPERSCHRRSSRNRVRNLRSIG